MTPKEAYKRFNQEEKEWLLERKSPSKEPAYTWEDMYFLEKKNISFALILGTIAWTAGLIIGHYCVH